MVFIVRQCSQRPTIPNASSGFALGCWALYKAAALIATEGFTGEIGFFGDVDVVRDHGGLATSMGLQNRPEGPS